ncbi:cell division protein ZapA [Pseudoalteromonas piscicida]|uniref:Cell division protein ZapA n=1 Tax=Pseudoalteromonas piscicida TaxID=43662 RepID=A0AAD0RJH6_PSEO7|nr:cell division protein ZapA [Pseudoalteromonas piscicida]ASD68417.1 cell division protein ZapA [Pseudoalteromonas piscicida]AXQ96769.1 cell division protein ZapA [Pseudoalteromonas piscicida]AXR03466.1 cell division protein ZapA [Pseudoalteromonas piscicida]
MSEQNNQVTVTLLGKSHQFACAPDQEEALHNAVALLDRRVEEMRKRSTVRNDHNALLLAALHLCHDLQALESKQQQNAEFVSTLIDKLAPPAGE